MISGGKSTISDVSINKTGDSSEGDNTSFYGINSSIVAKDGANATIKNAIINTDAKWCGVTYKEDALVVNESFKKLIDEGVYSTNLVDNIEQTKCCNG